MNGTYFDFYGQYMIPPFATAVTGVSLFLFAVITLILAICLFGKRSKVLYAFNKTMAITGLVISILLTLVYAAIIGLVAASPELFGYQGGGIIGAVRDLTCGIFLLPAKFGVDINFAAMNTSIPFIFYTLTVFVPAAIGFITFIVSCIAQRSSRKARNRAVTQSAAPENSTPVNMNQPVQNPAPIPAPIPASAPAPVPAPVQDNTPVNEAPIQKLMPEAAQTPFEAETPVAEENTPAEEENTPAEVKEVPTEVTETPVAEENTPAEAENTPAEVEEVPTEVAETSVAEENTPVEAENTPAEVKEVPTEVAETPVAAETEEKPIDEDKILNLVATPPAENTVTNDKPLFCMNCGTALNGGAFCMNCGTPAREQKKLCSNCKAELADDARFCMVCGTKV